MSKLSAFFQVGGTLSEDAPSYIERPADTELLAALERHEFCLVLAPRQMGKSSLMVHAIARLKKKGVTSAVVDLQPLGSQSDFERWFVDVIYQIKRTARLRTNTEEWWKAKRELGPTQRFMAFLEEVVLAEVAGDVVLFFDEIDSVLTLPFSDDFFTTIRSVYNSRAVNPELKRLSVVLLGVATPSSFIKDRTRTPFNIGESISLTDFSEEKTRPFQDVLGPHSEGVVDRIFYWTNGQPLLVQKLAAAAYAWPPEERGPERVDEEVERSYLRLKIERDTHFKFIQDYLLDAAGSVRKTLTTYRDVLNGKGVEESEQSPTQARLKLAGVVRSEGGRLAPRNRIYEKVFNLEWVNEHLPADFQKRLAYGASAAFALAVVAFVWLWLFPAPAADVGSADRPLRVGIVTGPGYVSGLVANNGFKPNHDCIFFNKYGLEVEFLLMENIDVRNKAFIRGDADGVDIVWSSVDYWANELPAFVKAGVKARAIMQVDWSRGDDAIVAGPGIERIEDLKGKRIALTTQSPSAWLLEYSLRNSALNDEEQRLILNQVVVTPSSTDARNYFVRHEVDAAVVSGPDVLKGWPQSHTHTLISTQEVTNLIANLMVAREDFIRDHPDVIISFIRGWLDGVDEANSHPDKVVQLLMDNEPAYKVFGEQKTRDLLTKVKLADMTDNTQMFGLDGSDAFFDGLFKWASQAWLKRGYITSEAKPEQAKDISFLKKLYYEELVQAARDRTFKPAPPELMNKPAASTMRVNINFAHASSVLDENAQQALDPVAQLAQSLSGVYIRVEGNTDNSGPPDASRKLSQQRAQAVVDFLVQHYGLDRNRFIVVGNGPDKPLKPNTTEEGRAANRRIDIEVVPIE
jgi:outer membrane protein OmpA-like peptidoglycan-associated protein